MVNFCNLQKKNLGLVGYQTPQGITGVDKTVKCEKSVEIDLARSKGDPNLVNSLLSYRSKEGCPKAKPGSGIS